MGNNKNYNNNHNSAEEKPLQENVAHSIQDEGATAVAAHNEVFEETRQVVKRFLERSLSQNAKSSTNFMRPEGYHRLRKEGKLHYYQRQQSKPEQGSLVKRDSSLNKSQLPNFQQKRTNNKLSVNALPSRPSLNELTSASKKSFPVLTEQDHALCRSETDVRTLQRLSESESQKQSPDEKLILFQLMDSETRAKDGSFHSSDSLPSASEDGTNHHLRRKSFSKAVSKRSVISIIENSKKVRQNPSEEYESNVAISRESLRKSPQKDSDIASKSNSLQRQESLTVAEGSTSHTRQSSDHKDEESSKHAHGVEKKTSFTSRIKKMKATMSNKRKIKYKKSFEQPKTEEPTGGSEDWRAEERRSLSAGTARTTTSSENELFRSGDRLTVSVNASTSNSADKEANRQPASSKRKSPTPRDRSPSPIKSKAPMTLLRSLSQRAKSSPKPKHRVLHQSGSSSSLSHYVTSPPVGGQLERNKSGSLPLSVRNSVDQQGLNEKRRHSEDFHRFTSTRPIKHPSRKREPSPCEAPARPQHLDLTNKKTKTSSRIRRFFAKFRKRHVSESSTGSSRSHSLPSIPAALDSEIAKLEGDVAQTKGEAGQPECSSENGRLSSSDDESRPYHHRGSLSFSSGDLDSLTLPEKQKVYDDIAETLKRVSSKFNRHIQSRSSTPGSRLTTPESSCSSQEYRLFAKGPHSGPPSRQTSSSSSKGPVHSTGKSFRKYKDEAQPALTAYYNLRPQGKLADPYKLSRHLPVRRHTHHAQTGSLDSPYATERHVQTRGASKSPKLPTPPASPQPETPGDVVDSPPVATLPDPVDVGDLESRDDECTEVDCAVRSFHPRSRTSVESEASQRPEVSTHQGSDVDAPLENHTQTPPDDSGLPESRPSTSRLSDEGRQDGSHSSEPIDEDKLVDLLVQALCQKGDEYSRSIDMPNGVQFEPVLRNSMIRYMSRVPYNHFTHFAKRFCHSIRQLVETSPTRHPEVFPVVMVFSMTELIVNLANSEAAQTAVNRVLQFSTQLVTSIVQDQGNDWGAILAQLQDTEDELAAAETPEDSPRRHGSTLDELD